MIKEDGGPAFPRQHAIADANNGAFKLGYPGMSLRDWFAGMALSAMTTAPDYSKGECNAAMAERAFLIADRMLTQREKQK